jgi:hypothetical protein
VRIVSRTADRVKRFGRRCAGREAATIPHLPGVVCQDEAGRLWDVLFLLRLAIGRSDSGRVVPFALHVRNDNRGGAPPLVRLKAVAGPDDDGAPCLTVMLPDED